MVLRHSTPEEVPQDCVPCHECDKLRAYLTSDDAMSRLTDAQLLHAVLALYDHNQSATAKALDLRRETIGRWLRQDTALTLFPKTRKMLLRHLADKGAL